MPRMMVQTLRDAVMPVSERTSIQRFDDKVHLRLVTNTALNEAPIAPTLPCALGSRCWRQAPINSGECTGCCRSAAAILRRSMFSKISHPVQGNGVLRNASLWTLRRPKLYQAVRS